MPATEHKSCDVTEYFEHFFQVSIVKRSFLKIKGFLLFAKDEFLLSFAEFIHIYIYI